MVALGSASCFDELPSPGTASEGSSESADATGSETSAMDGMSSSSANNAMTEPDNDTEDGSGGATTSAPPLEGLFACSENESCDTWERPSCDGACPPLDAAGTCLFGHLRSRGGAVKLLYKDCDGACTLNAIVPRGAGDDSVDRQSATLDGDAPVGFGEVQRCALVEPSFFEACIADFTAECADPANWMTDCLTPEKPLCTS